MNNWCALGLKCNINIDVCQKSSVNLSADAAVESARSACVRHGSRPDGVGVGGDGVGSRISTATPDSHMSCRWALACCALDAAYIFVSFSPAAAAAAARPWHPLSLRSGRMSPLEVNGSSSRLSLHASSLKVHRRERQTRLVPALCFPIASRSASFQRHLSTGASHGSTPTVS